MKITLVRIQNQHNDDQYISYVKELVDEPAIELGDYKVADENLGQKLAGQIETVDNLKKLISTAPIKKAFEEELNEFDSAETPKIIDVALPQEPGKETPLSVEGENNAELLIEVILSKNPLLLSKLRGEEAISLILNEILTTLDNNTLLRFD